MVAESPARPIPLYVERARRQMRRGALRSGWPDGFGPEIDPMHARARGDGAVTLELKKGAREAEPGACMPRRDRRAKPGDGYVELRRLPGWTYSGHAPVRLHRSHAELLAHIEDVSLALLIGPERVPVSSRTAPRARSARRRSRIRRSRSRDPDPDDPGLTAAPEREKCARIAGSSFVALHESAAKQRGHAG
jgi:hypothetical protein